MFLDASKLMNPTLINYGDQFLRKYFNEEDLLRKSQRKDENFDNGNFKLNELIDIFTSLEICSKNQDSYSFNKLDQNLTYRQAIVLKTIEKFKPQWIQRFKFGLKYVADLKESDPNLYQCLDECGVFCKDISQEAKNFISKIKKIIYAEDIHQKNKIELGAFGEELSIRYEFEKTGIRPFQESLWNDKSGYDIETYDKYGNIKRIEVKASKHNRAFITCNEWNKALQSKSDGINYEFHLWKIDNNKYSLARIYIDDLTFIPNAHLDGHHFDNYIINFEAFQSKFKEFKVNQIEENYRILHSQ
tara:strand:- start:1485 stop:2390 length:906 start_codon:yes stop_codon:yes gene_type:complete